MQNRVYKIEPLGVCWCEGGESERLKRNQMLPQVITLEAES